MPHKLNNVTADEIRDGYARDPDLTSIPWSSMNLDDMNKKSDGVPNPSGGWLITPSALLTITLQDGTKHIWDRPAGKDKFVYREPV